MTCTRCGEPTQLRRSGLLAHEDRTRDAGHLPISRQPGDTRTDAELEARERQILGVLQGAGFEPADEPLTDPQGARLDAFYRDHAARTNPALPPGIPPDYWDSPLGERYRNGDR